MNVIFRGTDEQFRKGPVLRKHEFPHKHLRRELVVVSKRDTNVAVSNCTDYVVAITDDWQKTAADSLHNLAGLVQTRFQTAKCSLGGHHILYFHSGLLSSRTQGEH